MSECIKNQLPNNGEETSALKQELIPALCVDNFEEKIHYEPKHKILGLYRRDRKGNFGVRSSQAEGLGTKSF